MFSGLSAGHSGLEFTTSRSAREWRVLAVVPVLLCLVAAGPAPREVTLSPQPGTPLDQAARALVTEDLAEAGRAGERPLLLVGSAPLGTASDRPALFVQLQSARECGSAGCSTGVWLWRGGKWVRVLDGASGTLAVAATRTRGMADLVAGKERYAWTGRAYRDVRGAPAVDLRRR